MSNQFVTAINCMDGRVQEPVIKWMKEKYNATYVDMITEAGPNKHSFMEPTKIEKELGIKWTFPIIIMVLKFSLSLATMIVQVIHLKTLEKKKKLNQTYKCLKIWVMKWKSSDFL